MGDDGEPGPSPAQFPVAMLLASEYAWLTSLFTFWMSGLAVRTAWLITDRAAEMAACAPEGVARPMLCKLDRSPWRALMALRPLDMSVCSLSPVTGPGRATGCGRPRHRLASR